MQVSLSTTYVSAPTLAPRDVESLAGLGHHLLLTTCGPLDVLGTIGRDEAYDLLLPTWSSARSAATALRRWASPH